MLRSHGISQICHTYSENMHPIYPSLRCGISYTRTQRMIISCDNKWGGVSGVGHWAVNCIKCHVSHTMYICIGIRPITCIIIPMHAQVHIAIFIVLVKAIIIASI